ncbi:megakaryocyte and platelet inhibitory receptor G6b isoform X2 [Myotis yumanensis]|uniref:megakaryocyte and platelet inhibitory receptor G6b isoform X2 n=1 Tax=Myotis yumanensis TaxID=159337 RepID=UPI0038D19C6B
MALVLQLLLLLLWRAQGDPGVSLDGRPGDRVNLSCAGVSQPIRWVWAPSFPACKGLPKGRRRILWASSSGTPTVSPAQPFAGRLRVLDHPGIRRLELLLSAGDSGTFICRGRHEDESHTVLHVLGDAADCRGSGPSLGARPHARRGHSPDLLCPPHIVPRVKAEPQRPAKAEEPKTAGDLDQESSLLYADLDRVALSQPCRLPPVVPADSSTIYAVVV